LKDFKPQIIHIAKIVISPAITIYSYIQFTTFNDYIGVQIKLLQTKFKSSGSIIVFKVTHTHLV